jgi:hypothetical protein
MNIISPSMPEGEVRERVSRAPVTRLESVPEPAPRETPAAHSQRPSAPATPQDGEADAKHGDAVLSPSVQSDHTLRALINLLEEKGIITRKELLEELRRQEPTNNK